MGFEQHKRATRVTINQMFSSLEEFLTQYATNISRTGVFIKTEEPLPVGTRVNFRFSIAMDELETVSGVGDVVRCMDDSNGEKGMALNFIDLDPKSETLIHTILSRKK